MKKTLILCVILLAGCATKYITPRATGGSKADATVQISYEADTYLLASPFEFKWEEEQQIAIKRCQAWGYSAATRFDDVQETCSRLGIYSHKCVAHRWTVNYQCTD